MTGTGVQTSERKSTFRTTIGPIVVLVALLWSGVCAGDVLNPGFEQYYMGLPYPRLLPSNWGHKDHLAFGSYLSPYWKTEGAYSAALFSRYGKEVKKGDYQSFYQTANLTGVGRIIFDVRLSGNGLGTFPFEHFEAALLVDGRPLWKQKTDGEYRDQAVNVSGLSGFHLIELRNTALEDGQFDAAYWTEWDNVQTVEGSDAIDATVDIDPDTLNLRSNGKWITCYIELPDGRASEIAGDTVTLEGVPAHMGKEGWATSAANEANTTDRDEDGIPERMVKFDRSAVQAALQAGEATLTVEGQLNDGTSFEGSDVIRVIDKGGKGK